jgi:hypothetical protein
MDSERPTRKRDRDEERYDKLLDARLEELRKERERKENERRW